MSRSSTKGFYFCDNTFKAVFKQYATNLAAVSHYMQRGSTLPNTLVLVVPQVETGKARKRFIARPTSSTHKVGGFLFTRKPYVFPNRKKRGILISCWLKKVFLL